MEQAGIGLAIMAEARTLVDIVKTRIANIRHAPDNFRNLTDDLDRLMRHVAEVETHIQSTPTAIPASISLIFNETLSYVHDILNRCNSTLERVCSKAFPGSSSGASGRVMSFFRRTARATALSDTMNTLQPQVQAASAQLLTLISILVTGLKGASNVPEAYRVGASTPALPRGAHLNFGAKDAEGNHSTPEGKLKASILSTESSSTVTAAAGVITLAHGVVGMAGVGKTIALQGLAFDNDICVRFPDGIQYIALGQGASSPRAIGEVAKIMRLSGACVSVSAVLHSPSLREAVDYAVAWFREKKCLFLVDDVWPTKDCQTGFLHDLRQLLRSCGDSRMAITTRSTTIADAAGRIVDFAPRAPLGTVSVNIFMIHATRDAKAKAPQDPTGDLRRSVATILTICAGLPIALAVTGCAVAFLTKEQGDFESACDVYAAQLGKQRSAIGETEVLGGGSLNAGLSLSLEILEAQYAKLKTAHGPVTDHTIADLYTSLCVVRNQAWVPISVLSGMWQVDNDFALAVVRLLSGLSLCKLRFRKRAQGVAKEGGLMLHDLQLEFCKRQAETMRTSSIWHTRLLSGYLEPVPNACEGSLLAEQDDIFKHTLLAYSPRPWWSVPDDGYIHVDVVRHLLSANSGMEVAALLLDARWTHVRAEIGGVLALKSDFEYLFTSGAENLSDTLSQSFELIWKAIQLSWGRVSEGKRSFFFQVCGRLFNLRTGNAIVVSYLRSVEMHTPRPYLLPLRPFFPDPGSALVMEVPVGCRCYAVDSSPCGRFIAAAAGWDVVVANASTGEILKRLEGHSRYVECVRFAAGSKKIVSGLWDGFVAVWEWETSESPGQLFKEHMDVVTGVAVSSDGTKMFSCSRDCTVRIWEANTGAQIEEFPQQSAVDCIAVSNDDRYIAIGLKNGTLKVVDCCTGDTIFEDHNAHGWRVSSAAFCAKGQRLASASWDNTIRVLDTASWTSVGELFRGHRGRVRCVVFSPDGQQFASGSNDGTVRLWDVNTGRIMWTSSKVHSYLTSVAFTPGCERILSGSIDGSIRVWDTRVEGEENQGECAHSSRVRAVAITHDGLRVASGSRDRTIRMWDGRTGHQIGRALEGHRGTVTCISFRPDGRTLVSGSLDKSVRLWNAESLKQIGNPLRGHTEEVWCVSFSSDGVRIVSGSDDKTVRIWDAASGMQIGDALQGHTGCVKAVSESSGGRFVVSRDNYDGVIIWNRSERTIVWQSENRLRRSDSQVEKSTEHDCDIRYGATSEEAEKIIRSCGQETPHLWPNSFPVYTAEVCSRDDSVYANVPAENTLLGTFPSEIHSWKYHETRKLFVAGLRSGAVATCSLMVREL